MEKLNKLIELTEKKVGLLKELKQSKIYVTKKYELVKHGHYQYSLILIKTGKIVCHGQMKRLNSYMNLRNINIDSIYQKPTS